MSKIKKGYVLAKNGLTIKVSVENVKTHPIYEKKSKVQKNYLVHDEKQVAKLGDFIEIEETRPISRLKHFKVKKILKEKQ